MKVVSVGRARASTGGGGCARVTAGVPKIGVDVGEKIRRRLLFVMLFLLLVLVPPPSSFVLVVIIMVPLPRIFDPQRDPNPHIASA